MTTIEDEILFNRYAQGVVEAEDLLDVFLKRSMKGQEEYFNLLVMLVGQSRPELEDVELAIESSNLKPTYTPCVVLRKGVEYRNLKKIVNLPSEEHSKAFRLLLALFRISFQRRYKNDPNPSHKWWYWDLSKDEIVASILKHHNQANN